ncbi:MAG: PfkB family carbohydrate kinase [Vampirovibrionia bacterium]
MAKLLIVGSIALDSIKTPYGDKDDILGGSCSYASVAASLYCPVNMVGVVGKDFPQEAIDLFKSKNIDLSGLETAAGETFRWKGYYEYDMNQAHTLATHLNVFGEFAPKIPEEYKDIEYVFLANIHPALQLDVLNQIKKPKFVVCDTMNLWIDSTRKQLLEVIKKVDLLLVNEEEARQLCETPNLMLAAKKVLEMGPQYVIIKKGEHGALLFSKTGERFLAPAYPLNALKDPTGAGDTFAGGMMGVIANQDDSSIKTIKSAIVTGTLLASFDVEDFSLNRLKEVTMNDLSERYKEFEAYTKFEPFISA